MASLPNAKFSREKPFLVRRYNYRYGVYNGKTDLNTPDQPMSRKKCHNVAKKFRHGKNSINGIQFMNKDPMYCGLLGSCSPVLGFCFQVAGSAMLGFAA